MKKIWKILGAAALVAGLTPYKVEHNEQADKKTYRALLWKITTQPSDQKDGRRQVTVNVGFQNPADHSAEDAERYADELRTGMGASEEDASEEDFAD